MDGDSVVIFSWFGIAILLFTLVALLRPRPSYWFCLVLALMSALLLAWMRFVRGVQDLWFVGAMIVLLNVGLFVAVRFWVNREKSAPQDD